MWWTGETDERYWMELTDRDDLGNELWNFAVGESGRPIASTSLLERMAEDEVVYHYDKRHRAIVGCSRIATTSAHGGQRHGAPYVARGIADYTPITPPVTLSQIRAESPAIFGSLDRIRGSNDPPHFLPFVQDDRGGRPNQAYLSKLPAAVVAILNLPLPTGSAGASIGKPLDQPKARPGHPAASDPFPTDPDKVDRGTQAHYDTEEALRAFVASQGARPREANVPPEPPFDLAWHAGEDVWIAEVKSITKDNEEKQLRYGLGQLLRYGHHFASHKPRLVLVVERQVTEQAWLSTCASVGVQLVWPSAFDASLVTP